MAGARAQDPPPATARRADAPRPRRIRAALPRSSRQRRPPNRRQNFPRKDTDTTFKLRVNLVQVKVVVRDAKGELVRDLKREDFQLYDQGKLQAITTFGVETPETAERRMEAAAKTQQDAE